MAKSKRKPNRFHGRVEHADGRLCAAPGCRERGEFRAPARNSADADERIWLCLAHVREANEGWNYFNGLAEEEAARLNHRYSVWDRPTWPFGAHPQKTESLNLDDLHGLFAARPGLERFAERSNGHGKPLTREERDALAVLGLDEKAAAKDIKLRYKELVKRYHPDTNGGDRSHEKRLARVIRAYNCLAGVGEKSPPGHRDMTR